MSYLQRSRKESNNFFKIFAVLVVLVLLTSAFFSDSASGVLRNFFSPFWRLKEFVLGSDQLEATARSERSIIAENENLERTIAKMRLEMLTYDDLAKENEELRRSLNASRERKLAVSDVLARPPVSLYDTFVVSNENGALRIGQRVTAYGLVPVGEVAEIDNKTALVRLYSSPGNTHQVILSGSHETIEITGVGGGNFEVRMPKAVSVNVGDKAYWPGTLNILGIVGAIESQESDSFKTVHLKSPINIFKVSTVEILL